jgi:hypothetical protein
MLASAVAFVVSLAILAAGNPGVAAAPKTVGGGSLDAGSRERFSQNLVR